MQRAIFVILMGTTACGTSSGTSGTTTSTSTSTSTTEVDPASISTEEQVRNWANTASAPNVEMLSMLPMIQMAFSGDKECPSVIEQGNTSTVTGDCTDITGSTWTGSMVSSVAQNGSGGEISYQDFSFSGSETCGSETRETYVLYNGTYGGTDAGDIFIDLEMEISAFDEDCSFNEDSYTVLYDMTLQEQGPKNTYNGSGTIYSSSEGGVFATTVDEVVDDEGCGTEAESGTTTLEAGDDVVVVTYDGATDCSDDSTVQWSLNGEDQGELSGVACSAVGSPIALMGPLLAALLVIVPIRRRE